MNLKTVNIEINDMKYKELRDEFAMAVLSGYMARDCFWPDQGDCNRFYAIADLMLDARKDTVTTEGNANE